MLDVACLHFDVEVDPDIKEKSDAWQVAQRVTLRTSKAAEDRCVFNGGKSELGGHSPQNSTD